MPIGAEITPEGVNFRVWAPEREKIEVRFEKGSAVRLKRGEDGYFFGLAPEAGAGSTYKYQLDAEGEFPDPASRFQPSGPHGYSEVIDPTFKWTDGNWPGCQLHGQVIYELHLGTFTPEGTWSAAETKLPYLKELGVTLLEIMPVSDFPGKFGWGYDGVQLYAPASIYGRPDDMRRFVNRAHELGIGVILDVVYNHMGPDGNYLPQFSPLYFSDKHDTDWGKGINYDGKGCTPVREFFRENAAYWIREYHLDGLRLDATQDIHDDSEPHILSDIVKAARSAAGKRDIIIIGENEPQETRLIRSVDSGGYGLDALWNDDLHHTATVALNGRSDAYYTDYKGTPQEFVSALKYGYLFQGQWYRWQKHRRGTPNFDTPRAAMVTFIQNHDQIANSAHGSRAHMETSPGRLKAITALILLGPGTPMLFQGQEFASSSRFLFFADHGPELAELVRKGRVEFLGQWRSHKTPEMFSCFAEPDKLCTFEECKLDFTEVEKHKSTFRLHKDLLALRRTDPVISRQGEDGLDGAVLSEHAFVIRYFSPGFAQDRLLVVNLGRELSLDPAPEPLLAPPLHAQWEKIWSSEDPQYGGCGTAPLDSEENWRIPAESAVVLKPIPAALHTGKAR
jgi:maltooligosyltrehalose trehalohydrolase